MKLNRKFSSILIVIIVTTIIAALLVSAGYLPLFSNGGTRVSVQTFQSNPSTFRFVTEYQSQSSETEPNAIAVDSNGTVWFILENETSLAQLFPANGTLREYGLPEANKLGTISWGVAIQNSKNLVWFADQASNSIWSFDIVKKSFTRYALATPNAFPSGIAIDQQDGKIWFTEMYGNKLGEINASTGSIREIDIPVQTAFGLAEPTGITVDGNGTVWMTLPGANGLASYAGDKFQFYNLTGRIVSPVGIAVDSTGNIWITQHGPSFLTQFNPKTDFLKTISTSVPSLGSSLPYYDYVDGSGNVWLNEHYGNSIAEYIPSTGSMIEYQIPSKPNETAGISGILTMTLSQKGAPWFTELFTGKVGTLNVSKSLNLTLSFANNETFENPIRIPTGTNIGFDLSIHNTYSVPVKLNVSIGNFTGTTIFNTLPANLSSSPGVIIQGARTGQYFSFNFSTNDRLGDFHSTLKIGDINAKSGIYFMTISASTSEVTVSKVIEIIAA